MLRGILSITDRYGAVVIAGLHRVWTGLESSRWDRHRTKWVFEPFTESQSRQGERSVG